MIKVLFVCHGNICRSVMAEMMMKHLIKDEKENWEIYSTATSREEIGCGIYPDAYEELHRHGIYVSSHRANQITRQMYDTYDYIVCMDANNVRNVKRMFGITEDPKLFRLLDITSLKRDISDPWYSGDFEKTYEDLSVGLRVLIDRIHKGEL
ncbi:MAG: low molecular weight phosphotyrosine protein phosphatase [Erysipelotrichaceae bacterium]|nr:low molecular weight phosphotyrosine protein phosphatase [Erysipelotrichaceae bacterium]